jgi:tetratricopeptide (TPR) repeat protein
MTNLTESDKAAGEPAPEVERLRGFCHALLRLLDDPAGTAALPRELARAIGAGVGEVADGLRREADALTEAVAGLRHLPTGYLTPTATVCALVAELEAARNQAARFADTLDALREDPAGPRPLPAALPPLPLPQGEARPAKTSSPDSPEASASADPFPFSLALEDGTETVSHSTETDTGTATTEIPDSPPSAEPSPTRRAAAIFREAQKAHRQRDFDRAVELYTETIRIDPRFGPAYSRRGQLRLAQGQIDGAVADFDTALELDDTAAEAWWWRGDALAVADRLDEAVTSYIRALSLRPDLARARFNLAVAFQRLGQAAAKPPTPPAEPARPNPPPSDVLPVLAPPSTPSRPTTAEPAMKEAGQLVVRCPHCDEPGEVSWDRLGKVFVCKACNRRFGVRADGQTTELVESGGRWVEAGRVREQARRRRKRRLAVAGVVLAAVLFPAVGVAGWRAVRPAAPAPLERELPTDLTARAELFTQAWLSNDSRLMRRLTSPAHERVVHGWSVRHPPPPALRGPADGTPPDGVRIEVTHTPVKPGQELVRVRVSNPTTAPDQPPVELTLVWEQRGDTWYFLPPTK